MPQPESNGRYFDTLRLSEEDRAAVFSRLDAKAAKHQGSNRRKDARFRYQVESGLLIEITHPGGSAARYLIRPRDLSRHGMSFLHGGFLHTHSACHIFLRNLRGKDVSIVGRVVRCQHVGGKAHDIGIRFDRPVRLTDYLELGDTPAEPRMSTELPALEGSVLHIEDSAADRELLLFHLRHHTLRLTSVTSLAEAAVELGKLRFDLVLADVDLPEAPGVKMIESLRGKGFRGTVLAVTADDAVETAAKLKALHNVAVLVKPYALEDLLAALGAVLAKAAPPEPIMSAMWSNQQMRPLIAKFVSDMRERLKQVEQQADAGVWAAVQQASLELKGAAGTYGFAAIQHAARELHVLTKAQTAVEEIRAKVRDLMRLADAAGRGIDGAGQGT